MRDVVILKTKHRFRYLIAPFVGTVLCCFSNVSIAATLTVTSTANSGAGSLRDQIAAAASGDTINFTLADGSTIILTTGAIAVNKNLTIDATTAVNLKITNSNNPANALFTLGAFNLNLISNTNTTDGNSTSFSGSIQNGGGLNFQQQDTATYPGNVTGTGTTNFDVSPGETLTLTGTNTSTGDTTIASGTVLSNKNDALTTTGSCVINPSPATLSLNNNISQTLNDLGGGGNIALGAGSALTLTNSAGNTFSGVISGSGTVIKSGANTETLSGVHTATGTMTINDGTIAFSGGEWVAPVQLTSVGASVPILLMSGGLVKNTITGDANFNTILNITNNFQSDFAVNNVRTINVTGGTWNINNDVTGYNALTLNGGGAVVSLNPNGTLSNGITITNGTFTYAGGGVTGNIVGAVGSTVNVNANFSPAGTIIANNLNVNNSIFTPSSIVTVTNDLTVGNGSSFTANSNTTVSGTLGVQAGGTLSLGANLTMPANSTLTNAGTFNMNNRNLVMGNLSTLNTGNLSTSGTITAAAGGAYALNVQAGTFTVNNPVSGYNALAIGDGNALTLANGGSLANIDSLGNGSIFNFNGGAYTGTVGNGGANAGSVMNVNSNLTTPAPITIGTLNVQNGATFTLNQLVTQNTAFNIAQNSQLNLLNDIAGAGTVTNSGTIVHNTNVVRNINTDFVQTATGALDINISSSAAGNYSQFNVTGNATFNNQSSIVPTLPNGTAGLSDGNILTIMTTGAPIVGGVVPTVASTGSNIVTLVPSVSGNNLILTVQRQPYATALSTSVPSLQGVAGALDTIIANGEGLGPYKTLLNELDATPDLNAQLAQLLPTGVNNALYFSTVLQQEAAMTGIFRRLEAIREGNDLAGNYVNFNTGYSAGDMTEYQGTYGPMVFGNSIKQSSRGGLSGYTATTGGVGVSVDIPILQYFRAGLGASYGSTAVKQSDNTGSNTNINSFQTFAYGSSTYGPVFLDTVLSAGFNRYTSKRNIPFLTQTATATYNGSQYGAKVQGGFSLPCYQLEFSPMVVAQYVSVSSNSYVEKGADIYNMDVSTTRTSGMRVSLGGRVADRSQADDFFPELHAFYIVDVRNPSVQTTSRFTGGGPSFVSTGVIPPKSGINVGASLTTLLHDNFLVGGGYDFEMKKTFKSHSASLKFKFLF